MTSPSPLTSPRKLLKLPKIQASGEVICAFSHFHRCPPATRSTTNLTLVEHLEPLTPRLAVPHRQRTINLTHRSRDQASRTCLPPNRAKTRISHRHKMHNQPHHYADPRLIRLDQSHNEPHHAALRHFYQRGLVTMLVSCFKTRANQQTYRTFQILFPSIT